MARKRRYETPQKLERAVQKYFKTITRRVAVTDAEGRAVYNELGEAAERVEYLEPPSVSGLCLALGIDRRTWANYCEREEYQTVTAWARERMEAWLEEQLLTRDKGLNGIIFSLQNNYGWKSKREVELGDRASAAVAAASVPLSERAGMIKELAALAARDQEEMEQ